MEKETIEKLLLVVTSDSDRAALSVLYNAWVKSFQAYSKETTKTNLSEWKATERALKEKVEELEGKYSGSETAAILSNRMAAVIFLKDLGYKIQKSKLYNDEKAGLIKVNQDGTVNETDVRAYAERYLKKVKSGGRDDGDLDRLYREKAEAELIGLQMKNERLQFDMEQSRKEWIRREDAETQLAVKLGAVDAQMKGIIRDRSLDWIYAIGGDPKKLDLLIDLANADMDGMFNRLAELEDLELVVRLPPASLSETGSDD